MISRIVFSTEALGLSRFSGYQTPAEIAASEANRAVVLSQPHRMPIYDAFGRVIARADDKRLESALGRFCAMHKPRPLGDHCYQSGLRYGEIVREYKNAMGFDTPGRGSGDFDYLILTGPQVQARKELAIMRKREADEILMALMPRLPRAMEKLCYDEFTPSIYDEALIIDGLVLLARKYGFSPRNIRD